MIKVKKNYHSQKFTFRGEKTLFGLLVQFGDKGRHTYKVQSSRYGSRVYFFFVIVDGHYERVRGKREQDPDIQADRELGQRRRCGDSLC